MGGCAYDELLLNKCKLGGASNCVKRHERAVRSKRGEAIPLCGATNSAQVTHFNFVKQSRFCTTFLGLIMRHLCLPPYGYREVGEEVREEVGEEVGEEEEVGEAVGV